MSVLSHACQKQSYNKCREALCGMATFLLASHVAEGPVVLGKSRGYVLALTQNSPIMI